ncbi:MAG: DHH family phosphoesterase [Patescibacteria group bacterium]|nr:DHH family phosphoesterase [Patescibacteria group bacterium]
MEIKNLKKAANRILKAIKDKERIILYGDSDLDGATSVIVAKETIKNLGGKISAIYFPDREIEGHGLTDLGLDYLKKFKPALLIIFDCGIGNFKEIKKAKAIGFDVIIVDHHKVLDKLPDADIIVDPQQKGEKYPFKGFAAAGLSFKLSELLLEGKMSQSLRKNFLEIVALATIADMMPQEADNKDFIEEGLSYLEDSWRPGIKAFFETDFFKSYDLKEKASRIISILNFRDIEDKLPASFRLLTTTSSKEAREMIPKLLEKHRERRGEIRKGVKLVEKKISRSKEAIIFDGYADWDFSIISPVASILCRNFKKPTFIFKKLKGESQGTVRVPSGIDSVSLMARCKKYVIAYGGHPKASGFRIKNKNLQEFKSCLIENL